MKVVEEEQEKGGVAVEVEATAAVFAVAGAGWLGLTPVSCCGHDKRMQAAQFLLSIWFRCGLQISRGCRGSLKRTLDMRKGKGREDNTGGNVYKNRQQQRKQEQDRERDRDRVGGHKIKIKLRVNWLYFLSIIENNLAAS